MNKTISTTISIALIVAGAVICYFCKFELAQITGFAMTMFGAGLAVANLWESRNKEAKSWLVILGIVLVGLGAFVAGLFQLIAKDQITQIISLVVSLVMLIAGIVTVIVANTTAKKLNR